jgi:uncharacterized membrane protein
MEIIDHTHYLIQVAIEWAVLVIEALAVAVIVAGVAVVAVRTGTVRYVLHMKEHGALQSYRQQLGKPLLLGLELLVAADVIRTVASQATLNNVAVLGLMVLVRTLLSWSLVVEMEGRWPWQGKAASVPESYALGDK